MGPREQVIGINIVWAGAEDTLFVRGMAINVFASSLVWFISENEQSIKGTHYIESRVQETRDVILRILACLVDVPLDQIKWKQL